MQSFFANQQLRLPLLNRDGLTFWAKAKDADFQPQLVLSSPAGSADYHLSEWFDE